MAVFKSFILLLFLTTPSSILASTPDSVGDTPPPPPPPAVLKSNKSAFRPSVAIVVGVLTTMFSVTFLLLLYAKHCKRGRTSSGYGNGTENSRGPVGRKNSGIDRRLIESLPIFKFRSLRGQKEGLECAVCLNRFEAAEVLRLLPKCKHAFHVECVDTWLDAHSTCPLCRYRVDPEDILLVDENKASHQICHSSEQAEEDVDVDIIEEREMGVRRMSGRHSSAGERGVLHQIIVERQTTSSRRSLDSSGVLQKKNNNREAVSESSVSVGCFERHRKDGLLLSEGSAAAAERKSFERRFEHRIILFSGELGGGGSQRHRWSDVQPSDLLYLRSEKIISDSRGLSKKVNNGEEGGGIDDLRWQSGRGVINGRSVSEITGLSRGSNDNKQQQRQAGVVSRWLAWISESHSQPPLL